MVIKQILDLKCRRVWAKTLTFESASPVEGVKGVVSAGLTDGTLVPGTLLLVVTLKSSTDTGAGIIGGVVCTATSSVMTILCVGLEIDLCGAVLDEVSVVPVLLLLLLLLLVLDD